MNSTLFLRKLCSGAAFVLLLFGTLFGLSSCKDEVDASNLVTKTEATVWDYIDSVAIYSDYAALLRETHTGDTADANSSSLASFVSGYGNFTVLAPDNEAIANYVMEATGGATSDWHQLSAEDKQYIAENSIIDHGDEPAYAQADFPTAGTFSLGTLDNRLLTIELTDDNQFLIEGTAHVVRPDIKLKNGYIHGVDAVIALGCVVRGDTPHFDYVCMGATQGIAQLNATGDVPVIYGLITTNNMQQAEDRAGGRLGNKGDECAVTAIKMIDFACTLKK